MKQHVQTDLKADREVASTLAELTIGGSLTSIEITLDSSRGEVNEACLVLQP